jgi:hypothetical protein
MKKIVLFLMLLLGAANGDQPDPSSKPSVSLDQEQWLTYSSGILIPSQIIKLTAKQYIKFRLTDGTEFSGVVTKSEFRSEGHFECYGELFSHENAGFGFVLDKEGIFAGAVVLRNQNIVYEVKFCESVKGYAFIKRYKISSYL